jgi:hypothetical protein
MTTVANLERLEALIERLQPIADKQRGEVIEAGNWNQLVAAIVEVARATLAERAADAVPAHEHADQVELGWLDAKLRTLVLGGGLTDPAAEARLSGLTRKIDRLGASLDALADRVEQMRSDIAGVETRDIERQATLTQVARRVDGVFDSRDDVAGLRQSLRGLESDLRSAVELSRSLETGGERIDFADLSERIRGLEGLRGELTLPDGGSFSAASYERDLAELRAKLVTESELDTALDGVRGFVEGAQRDVILEAARTTTLETVESSLATLGSKLEGEVDRRLGAVEAAVPAQIDAATADLGERISAEVAAEQRSALAESLASFTREVTAAQETRLANFSEQITRDLEVRTKEISTTLRRQLGQQLERDLEAVNTRLGTLRTDLGKVRIRSDNNAAALKTVRTNLKQTERALQRNITNLNTTLTARITELDRTVDTRLKDGLANLREGLRTDLRSDLAILVRGLEPRLNENIRRSTTTEMRIVSDRMRGDVGAIAGTEVGTMRSGLEARIDAGAAVNAARLSGLVADEVRRATAGFDELIRREFESFLPTIDRRVEEHLRTIGGPTP